ncbi:hypothetical protein CCACVL1_27371 [Corchorus capsularis]|uniref:Bifunctional inhibitor/plant lipid transfer protein/seed storage helical domain-containing protein n=1 Tax=Corchorus capsularis TaxID=210143 RepID=A0A1R3GAP8_COCAP|nr:hypothetical protein CCACVL1_27371 [Corchorus capsularis]
MASSSSKASAPIAIFLAFNILFCCTLVSSQILPPALPSCPAITGVFPAIVCLSRARVVISTNITIPFGVPSICCRYLRTQVASGAQIINSSCVCEIVTFANTTLDVVPLPLPFTRNNASVAATNLVRTCGLTSANFTCTI